MGIGPFVIDALRQEDRVQLVPMSGFVGMDNGARVHALRDCCNRVGSDAKTKGSVRPLRSRMATTTRRLPF